MLVPSSPCFGVIVAYIAASLAHPVARTRTHTRTFFLSQASRPAPEPSPELTVDILRPSLFTMHILLFASVLLLQFSSLGSASPLAITPRASVPSCQLLPPATTSPSCTGDGCCAWKYGSDLLQAGDCRGTTTGSTPLSAPPAGWVASCEALRQSVLADDSALVFQTWAAATWYRLVANAGCSFEVRPDTGMDSSYEGIHVGNGDLADILLAAVAATQQGSRTAAGTTDCYGYPMQWRMLPAGN